MKLHLAVILPPGNEGLEHGLIAALAPHKLDEDSEVSIYSHHWDYWVYSIFNDDQNNSVRFHFPNENQDLLNSSAYVRELPDEYFPAAIIDPYSHWHDISDFGWKLINDPCDQNDYANNLWKMHVKNVFNHWNELLCVDVIAHC